MKQTRSWDPVVPLHRRFAGHGNRILRALRSAGRGLLVAVAILFASWFSALCLSQELEPPFPPPKPLHKVRLQRSVRVPMSDQVNLSTDLYFPDGISGQLPVILVRTPYNKIFWRSNQNEAHIFAGQGYVVAVQDVRGRFESEGQFTLNASERQDGYDTVEWLARQAWSNGKVGTYGCSYLGENQLQLAAMRHPNHVAAIAQAAGGVYRYAGLITGGAFELAAGFGWFLNNGSKLFLRPPPHAEDDFFANYGDLFATGPKPRPAEYGVSWKSLPVVEMLERLGGPPTDFEGVVSHEPADPWWDQLGYIGDSDRFDVPVLHVNSWYDYGAADTLALFNLLKRNSQSARARENQFVLVSPTVHCRSEEAPNPTVVGNRSVGNARMDYWGLYLRWFDYWLKGLDNDVTKMPTVQLYVMGGDRWRGEEEWPPAQTRFVRHYLHSEGRAHSLSGTGRLDRTKPGLESPDRFIYDPSHPVPSVGGPMCCTGTPDAAAGAFDQSEVETRADVLVYTTAVLEEGVEVTGPIELVLYVSSTARDTDFTGKLVDVFPDGTAYNVQEGILRARYREGLDRKVWMDPGQVVRLKISLHATSNYFPAGHRIRLEVSSSNFPRFDRNLNTAGNNYDEVEYVVVKNTVHHSSEYPSHLLLPIIE